jgi:predicted metal-dependent phosphoesterase TrpH
MIDLHVHSTNSDGTETPEELVSRACRVGLRALALTDHDNMGGAAAFLAACRASGLTGLAGVEISVDVENLRGTLHMLGYGVNPQHPALREPLSRVLEGRSSRNDRILATLNTLGMALEWGEVAARAGEDVVGRVHFAQALQARGYVASVAEAFDRYLAKGRPAYVNRYRLTAEEGIRAIRAAGGAAVLAHPYTWLSDDDPLEAGVKTLAAAGLAGVEVRHSDHTPEQTVALLRLAKRLGLLTTGGSDYHGSAKPNVSLGRGHGSLSVPDEYLPPLLDAVGRDNPWIHLG